MTKLKRKLISDLSLTHFNPTAEIVASDASEYDIGAVMPHKYKDSNMKAEVHASRSLIAAEKNYSQIKKAVLAIIFAMKKFSRFSHGRRFRLYRLLSILGSKK